MRRDPPLGEGENQQAAANDPAPAQPEVRPVVNEPRPVASEPRSAFSDPRPAAHDPRAVASNVIRPVVPDPRSSFDPRAMFNQQRAETPSAESRSVMPEQRSETRPFVAAQQPLTGQPQPGARVVQPPAGETQPVTSEQRSAAVQNRVAMAEQRVVEPEPLLGAEEAALRDIGDDPALKAPDISKSEDTSANDRQARRAARLAARNVPATTAKADDKEGRRANKLRRKEAKEKGKSANLPAPATGRALDEEFENPVRKRDPQAKTKPTRQWSIPWTALSFFLMVLVPAAMATFYYVVVASPQYQVETQFAVRGSNQSSIATLGLPMIAGGSSQSGDSYIVASYVESLQLIRDVQEELGIDLRQFYTRDDIDWLYKIEPDMPLEKFLAYWQDMTDVSFNSTTGNTTLYIYAFTAEDSKAIADAVLKVSEKLVNQLSESNRRQVMQVASRQVDRAEERLRKVQNEVRKLREEEKVLDPNSIGAQLNQQMATLQTQLTSSKTRLSALLKEVDKDAPQARALQRTIDSLEAELLMTQNQLETAASTNKAAKDDPTRQNVAEVLNKFEELTVEQGFATQAYTTALAAFETAIAEAQRQERYFATFVAPIRPEIALFPYRWLDSLIAFLVLLAVWMVTQFLYRSFRDHAI